MREQRPTPPWWRRSSAHPGARSSWCARWPSPPQHRREVAPSPSPCGATSPTPSASAAASAVTTRPLSLPGRQGPSSTNPVDGRAAGAATDGAWSQSDEIVDEAAWPNLLTACRVCMPVASVVFSFSCFFFLRWCVLTALIGVKNTALLAITTPQSEFNYFSELMALKDQHGRPLFRCIQLGLVCQSCQKTGAACNHRLSMNPYVLARSNTLFARQLSHSTFRSPCLSDASVLAVLVFPCTLATGSRRSVRPRWMRSWP